MTTSPEPVKIPLSPLHSIEIGEALAHLLNRAPDKDFTLHNIAKKTAPDGRELVRMDLVIAGRLTRSQFPLADQYPVHFVKSYHPWSLHGDPRVEFENHQAAAKILGFPEPIGYDSNSFRAAFLPGRPLSRLSPFTDVEPPERCLNIAQETPAAALIGLWHLTERIFGQLQRLHSHRFFHRDMELHNIIICTSPVYPFLIDFESSEKSFIGTSEMVQDLCKRDLDELLRLAIYLQAGLGRQEGALASMALDALPRLFKSSSTFAARLDAADRRAVTG
jgi:hypothetical protein